MAAVAGLLFLFTALFAPRRGVLIRIVRNQSLSFGILGEDLLAYLFRREERAVQEKLAAAAVTRTEIQSTLLSGPWTTSLVLRWNHLFGNIRSTDGHYELTDSGRLRARELIRSHRLWENYLVVQAGLPEDRIHIKAEQLEHFTSRSVREELEKETAFPQADPHGRPIPPEE